MNLFGVLLVSLLLGSFVVAGEEPTAKKDSDSDGRELDKRKVRQCHIRIEAVCLSERLPA